MYSGKTTLGRQIARQMGMEFIDLDMAFENRYHLSIPLFFQKYGEQAFRQLESKVLQDTEDMDNIVISTGGGTPCFNNNIDYINRHGISIYLEMTFDAIFSRMVASKKPRPAFANLTEDQRREKVATQLAQREPIYRQAKIIVNGFNPDIEAIINTINTYHHEQND